MSPRSLALSLLKNRKKVKSSVRLIQECADLICIPICDIFNQSISIGIFPEDWKCVRVTPLFKQRNKVDPDNYRPISAISVVTKMKVFKRIVCDQLYSYLELHRITCKYQLGFRSQSLGTQITMLQCTIAGGRTKGGD